MADNSSKPIPMLFLCWSGQRSKQVAEALKAYFVEVFFLLRSETNARVVMSDNLIDKGAPWSADLLKGLENARAGIVCLTPENQGSAWLHFEGGAIATHGLQGQDGPHEAANSNNLFGFLFTFDNTQIEGPLSLFQATIYRRDYDRDRGELKRMTRSVVSLFAELDPFDRNDELLQGPLECLIGRLRELQSVAFREAEVLPSLEGHARQIIQAVDDLGCVSGRVQALSAMHSLQQLLEERERQIELITAPSQQMFFERLVETLSVSRRGVEGMMGEEPGVVTERVSELVAKLKRMLQVAVEPLTPVLDDAWRYALYGLSGRPEEAYRKQKLLLVHPLESTLQRAEVAVFPSASKSKPSDEVVPAGHLLSRNEKLRALRSYWAWDRIAAYIHYCEDVSTRDEQELKTTLIELTRAVLKEISLVEVLPDDKNPQEVDDLPLRFAVRALILKVKLAIAHGRYSSDELTPVLDKSAVREVIDSRIQGETGLSFTGIDELIACLRKLSGKIGLLPGDRESPLMGVFKPPLLSLVDDLHRILGSGTEAAPLARAANSSA